MGYVCEHEFENKDHKNLDYSMNEYDLHARLHMTLRKNLKVNCFEIAEISQAGKQSDSDVVFSAFTLQIAVNEMNRLEGGENTKTECRYPSCPIEKEVI